MPIAITEDHLALAEVAADFLQAGDSRGAARALLEADAETLPPFWDQLRELGWLGLHLPEAHGGSGFGLAELVVVVEQLGREVAPGPFVPTVIASAVIAAAGSPDQQARYLPGLADGSLLAAVGTGGSVTLSGSAASGDAGTVLGAGLASIAVVPAGDDVVIVELHGDGVAVQLPQNVDGTRRAGKVELDGAARDVLPGARRALLDLARLILAAEAVGVARKATDMAAEYAKERVQFGRPIATFQAVKHHCANMLVAAELATAAVWDASRTTPDTDEFTQAAAMAACLAVPAADLCANLNIQVHGGIGFTWEHDAHLYLRRALNVASVVDPDDAGADVADGLRRGVSLTRAVDLPPEAEPIRDRVQAVVAELLALDEDARTKRLVATGYAVPHWPQPYGLEAGAVEQLVIEEEFRAAGIHRPNYGITGWVILTLVQHATEDQVARWVQPALDQEVIWCQLFSEPDAGSDAAGVKTKATRVDGGWLVNGQKVWTSGAHEAGFGLATVRTDPDAAKHAGITTMVIDMHAPGVEVRPLRQMTGGSDFNEVFFSDVFVADDDVVGAINDGWTVARATLGNESVSIGSGDGGMTMPASMVLGPFDTHPERLSGGAARVGRYAANVEAMTALNHRSAARAVAGGGPGPEGAVTKLTLSENAHEVTAMLVELAGPDLAFLEGEGMMGGHMSLVHRALSIAGGTSEIKRNQIGERILGLPRDPLIK
jgi:alkylation response protein AidB-like acyl-CoA dehydrogenase